MQQQAFYSNTACTGAPVVNPTNLATTCTAQSSTSSKYACGTAPTAYAALTKVYTDAMCTNLQATNYLGLNQKANTCVAEGANSAKVTCSSSAITVTQFAAAGCTGTSATETMNTACVR